LAPSAIAEQWRARNAEPQRIVRRLDEQVHAYGSEHAGRHEIRRAAREQQRCTRGECNAHRFPCARVKRSEQRRQRDQRQQGSMGQPLSGRIHHREKGDVLRREELADGDVSQREVQHGPRTAHRQRRKQHRQSRSVGPCSDRRCGGGRARNRAQSLVRRTHTSETPNGSFSRGTMKRSLPKMAPSR